MPRIYNVQMSRREFELVLMMIRLLVDRLSLEEDQMTITYRDLAARLGTSYRRLGQPLKKMAEVIHQCDVRPDNTENQHIPTLNALVVYSTTHLPCLYGLNNAEGVGNNADLRVLMESLNSAAKEFQHWDAVIQAITENSFE